MLAVPTEFPQAGSAAFLKGSADPVTIIRRNADRTALVRHDARRGELRSRDASGNTTVPLADLFETEDEAAWATLPPAKRPAHIAAKLKARANPRRAAPQARSGARSRSGAAGSRGEDAPAEAGAKGKGERR